MALLTQAVYNLVKLYLRSFCPPSASFRSPSSSEAVEGRSSREASGTADHLQFTLFALHGIPESWVSRSDVLVRSGPTHSGGFTVYCSGCYDALEDKRNDITTNKNRQEVSGGTFPSILQFLIVKHGKSPIKVMCEC